MDYELMQANQWRSDNLFVWCVRKGSTTVPFCIREDAERWAAQFGGEVVLESVS
jgi:hypothetical protein